MSTLPLSHLRPLLARLQDLKRVRTPDVCGSLAEAGFLRAWGELNAGASVADVALREAARAVAAIELAGIDATVLADAGLSLDQIESVYRRAIRVGGASLPPSAIKTLLEVVPGIVCGPVGPTPPAEFARLADQPRAGATHPTKPRLMLDPPESHADHCYVVAVSAVLLAMTAGVGPASPFLAGLGHHLHNIWLPDGGFAGEELLGEHLQPVMVTLTNRALGLLKPTLAAEVRAAFALLPAPDSPEALAFHAADVLDRVLWMGVYEAAATFRLSRAMDDLELVHPGPTQAFLNDTLAAAGVWPK